MVGGLEQYLVFCFEWVGKLLSDVIDVFGLQVIIERLGGVKENKFSLFYFLVIGNLVKVVMNYVVFVGELCVIVDVVWEV